MCEQPRHETNRKDGHTVNKPSTGARCARAEAVNVVSFASQK
jgi:hypothetical protein